MPKDDAASVPAEEAEAVGVPDVLGGRLLTRLTARTDEGELISCILSDGTAARLKQVGAVDIAGVPGDDLAWWNLVPVQDVKPAYRGTDRLPLPAYLGTTARPARRYA